LKTIFEAGHKDFWNVEFKLNNKIQTFILQAQEWYFPICDLGALKGASHNNRTFFSHITCSLVEN
jgi:hypothetical protein